MCDNAKCDNAESHNADCHNAECHDADCDNTDCHKAECQNAKCRSACQSSQVRCKNFAALVQCCKTSLLNLTSLCNKLEWLLHTFMLV